MVARTFAIGDIHGELGHLRALLATFPTLTKDDKIVFLGDFIDRGPHSAEVIAFVRHELPNETPAKIVCLRGNHEDAWLHVLRIGWDAFVSPPSNGCLQTLRSFTNRHTDYGPPTDEEKLAMYSGSFFPPDVVAWMKALPYWHEDEHAIYVHAGLPPVDGRFPHPSEVKDPTPLLWIRTLEFFRDYRGKRVVFGHTTTDTLPQELSSYTPDDPTDLYAGESVIGIDTGCGRGGFLTAIELPAENVYSRPSERRRSHPFSQDNSSDHRSRNGAVHVCVRPRHTS
jgi:serine/threonine protein phosphatase 1